jgi:hypothetical protein
MDNNRKKLIKKLVFGTLVTGGALGLAGVNAQAHGNASSHQAVALSWNFDDYDVKRQEPPKAGTKTVSLDELLKEAKPVPSR